MSFQYALEFMNKSVKGKNSDIEGSISILPTSSFPPLVNPVELNHAGFSSSSSIASGNFCPEFSLLDIGEDEVKSAIISIASNYRNRLAQKFKITRYSIIEGRVMEDYEIEFSFHYLLFSTIDNESSDKNHVYKLIPGSYNSEIVHTTYKLKSSASKMDSTAHRLRFLYVDSYGQGIIQRD